MTSEDTSRPETAGGPAVRPAITIDDVARAARVAKSTVSRALNNPGRLAEGTQQHIQEVAARLGYRPHPVARALGTRRTETIALLVPDLTNPFFFGIIRGAEHEAAAAGHHLLLVDIREDPEREAAQIRALAGSVDGLVLAASRLRPAQIGEFAAVQPIVTINRPVSGLPGVVVDATSGATSAVEHLASLGHRRIAYVSGPRMSWVTGRRWSAISAAAAARGVGVVRLGPFAGAEHSGPACADAVIAEGVTAAIAFNDLIAVGMLRRFAARGVGVPDEISVVGFDDVLGAEFSSPGLTTIAAPLVELGRTAVRLLRERGGGGRIVLPAPLVVRASSGPAPG